MQPLRTVTIFGGDRRPGERMPPLSKLLDPARAEIDQDIQSRHDAKELAYGKGAVKLAEEWRALLAGLVIEKDIPPPVNIRGIKSKARIAIEALEVGDSVLIPPQVSPASSVRMMIQGVRKDKSGCAFTAKAERGGLRVWRLE